jgi:PhnB protein
MSLNTYLYFNGRCEEAFKFYEKVLGGKIVTLMPHAGTPAENNVPPDWRSKIMHARLEVGDQVLMGTDAPPDHYHPPSGFSVSVHIKEPAEAERVFHALAQQGKIQMPIQATFWAAKFGMLTDQFGIPWMVNCDLPS